MRWGVFDSGVGGLTVVRALRRQRPGCPLVYLGDTARVPYGIRSVDTVREYAEQAARFMRDAGVDGLIVACNTASAVALDVFENCFPGPVLGMVDPGVEAALGASRTRRIGVIGTPATIRSDAYGRRLRSACPEASVHSAACPLFVPLAEEGWITGDVPTLVARRYLEALIAAQVDTLVLGCTHYPLLVPVISEVMGGKVTLVDSATAAARAAAAIEKQSPGGAGGDGTDRFVVTDAGGAFIPVAARFLGEALSSLETVDLI